MENLNKQDGNSDAVLDTIKLASICGANQYFETSVNTETKKESIQDLINRCKQNAVQLSNEAKEKNG
jgi:hypothetical protein